MTLILRFWRRYFLASGLFVACLLVYALYRSWTGPHAFRPELFTLRDDPSARFAIETCAIGARQLSFSGWLVSEHWPAPGATLILTTDDGADEVVVPYRLRARPDIAAATRMQGNPFHDRYGFDAIMRAHDTNGTASIVYLNILVGPTLYRTRHVCRS